MYQSSAWRSNAFWFAVELVAGGPLGLVGALTHHHGRWGPFARLVVRLGAVVEPFVIGSFTLREVLPWPTCISSIVSEAIILASGAAAVAIQERLRTRRAGGRSAASPEVVAASGG